MGQPEVYRFLSKHAGRRYGPTEIAKALDKSKASISAQLTALWKAHKIEKDAEGKYSVKESRGDLEVFRGHCEQLSSSILYLLQAPLFGHPQDKGRALRHVEDVESHMKTGYPEAFERYSHSKELIEKVGRLRREMADDLRERYSQAFKLHDQAGIDLSLNVWLIVESEVNSRVSGSVSAARDEKKWTYQGGGLWCDRIQFSHQETSKARGKKFVLEMAARYEGKYRETLDLSKDYSNVKGESDNLMRKMLKRIENGFPLEGYCEDCKELVLTTPKSARA